MRTLTSSQSGTGWEEGIEWTVVWADFCSMFSLAPACYSLLPPLQPVISSPLGTWHLAKQHTFWGTPHMIALGSLPAVRVPKKLYILPLTSRVLCLHRCYWVCSYAPKFWRSSSSKARKYAAGQPSLSRVTGEIMVLTLGKEVNTPTYLQATIAFLDLSHLVISELGRQVA